MILWTINKLLTEQNSCTVHTHTKQILHTIGLITDPYFKIVSSTSPIIDNTFPDFKTIDSIYQHFDKLNQNLVYKRSFYGATACTFLSSDPMFPLVQKWQHLSQAQIEYVCTLFFRRAFPGLSVPEIWFQRSPLTDLNHNKINQMQRFKKYKASMGLDNVLISEHVPIFEQQVRGSNFKFMCLNIFESGRSIPCIEDQISKLCRILGEVAGYDFLIGNTDRLIPDQIQGYVDDHDKFHKANGGNLIIQLDDKMQMAQCHLIDNAPFFSSFFSLGEKKRMRYKYSQDQDDDLDQDQSQSLDESQDQVGQDMRKRMCESFAFFINSSPKELESIARIIALGLRNECKAVLAQSYGKTNQTDGLIDSLHQQHEPGIVQNLVHGLERAKINLMNQSQSFINILDEISGDPLIEIETTRIFVDFVKMNLNHCSELV